MAKRRERRTFSKEFKKQMVQLLNSGKPRAEILRGYNLSASQFDRWTSRINKTGSTKEAENRSLEEQELIKLRKENQQLRMENDVLKQAALIFAQKEVARSNAHKYSISALCKCLAIACRTYYYEFQGQLVIKTLFKLCRANFIPNDFNIKPDT